LFRWANRERVVARFARCSSSPFSLTVSEFPQSVSQHEASRRKKTANAGFLSDPKLLAWSLLKSTRAFSRSKPSYIKVRRRITRPFSPTRHHVDKGARSIRSEHTRNHSGERRPAGRYGLPAITQSFLHFLLGKGVSAGAAFIVLIIAIRKLTHAEFAVYTSMNA